jgi:hypothetical protein
MAHLDEQQKHSLRMYRDQTCINNISKSLRVITMKDAQILDGRDGYCYFFTSLAEGPMLSTMAMTQIHVLLSIIHSYIPGVSFICDCKLLAIK